MNLVSIAFIEPQISETLVVRTSKIGPLKSTLADETTLVTTIVERDAASWSEFVVKPLERVRFENRHEGVH